MAEAGRPTTLVRRELTCLAAGPLSGKMEVTQSALLGVWNRIRMVSDDVAAFQTRGEKP